MRLAPLSLLITLLATPSLVAADQSDYVTAEAPTLAKVEVINGPSQPLRGATRAYQPPTPSPEERGQAQSTQPPKVETLDMASDAGQETPSLPSPSIVDELLRGATQDTLNEPGHLASLEDNAYRMEGNWLAAINTGVPFPDDLSGDEVWVHISVEDKSLTLMEGMTRLKHIDYVAFGNSGAEEVRERGSRLTPIGEFRIDHINKQSKFHRFFRIDYPNPAVAEQALAEGVINQSTHDYIKRYYARHGKAPMDTPLGGHLGLHGLGNRDAYAHTKVHWTDGCTAVTNKQISALEPWLALGTRVIIQ